MRLGIGTYTYTWAIGVPGREPAQGMTGADLVRRAAGFGLHLVQICDNLPLHRMPDAERADLKALAAALGVSIQVGTRGSRVAHLRTYIRLAAEFASAILRVVIDSPGDEPSPAQTVRRIREVLPDLEQRDVRLAIENHDRFSVSILREIVEAAGNPRVGICLDTVNSFGALEGPGVVADALLPYTMNLHVKDFAIRRPPHGMGFEIFGTPAGRGRLDIPGLLARLEAANPRADAILELWTPPEPTIEATVRKEAEWAKRSIDYLKRVLGQGEKR